MNTIFIGGSRNVTRLPKELEQRLDTVIEQGHRVILGDANGADKAVQKHLARRHYTDVIVFCSGNQPRNNVGGWTTRPVIVEAKTKTKDYQYYASKDREMARDADFGLMIWDGKSPGTLLNVVRLLAAGKIAVLYNLPTEQVLNFKAPSQLREYIQASEPSVQSDIEKRATLSEKRFLSGENIQPSLLDAPLSQEEMSQPSQEDVSTIADLNAALSSGNINRVIDILGALARMKGMSHIARDTGLARESLYRSLDSQGNPEFATVMKVLSSMGVTLEARRTDVHER